MATEVIDIITRLGYTTETRELERSLNTLRQIESKINQLVSSINRLNSEWVRSNRSTATSNAELEKQIASLRVELDGEIKKIQELVLANQKLQSALAAQAENFKKLQGEVLETKNTVGSLVENLTGGGAKSLVGSLVGAFGVGAAISIVTGLLYSLANGFAESGNKAQESEKKIQRYDKSLKDLGATIEKVIGGQTQIPTIFGSTEEASLQRQIKLLEAMGGQEGKILAINQKLSGVRLKALEEQKKAYEGLRFMRSYESASDIESQVRKSLPNASNDEVRKLVSSITSGADIGKIINDAQSKIDEEIRDIRNGNSVEEEKYNAKKRKEAEKSNKSALKEAEKYQNSYEKLLQQFKSSTQKFDDSYLDNLDKEVRAKQKALSEYMDKSFKPMIDRIIAEEIDFKTLGTPTLSDNDARKLDAELSVQKNIRDFEKNKQKEEDKRRKDDEDKRKKAIDKQKQLYTLAAQQTLDALEQIHNRQITLLNIEMEVRRDRLTEALRLAEYGNTEVLRMEQERMKKLQEERDKIVRRQLQQNQLLQASSSAIALAQSIQAVANAAAYGDGYTAAIRVAAVIAALTSGFAFVTNLVGAFKTDSFKDGIVNYKGKGTGTSDSNLVRISNGESVITAKATQQYSHILEAMNNNKPLPVAYTAMPAKFGVSGNNSELHKEIKALREAYEASGISVKTAVSNGAIATIVESQRKFERARWK